MIYRSIPLVVSMLALCACRAGMPSLQPIDAQAPARRRDGGVVVRDARTNVDARVAADARAPIDASSSADAALVQDGGALPQFDARLWEGSVIYFMITDRFANGDRFLTHVNHVSLTRIIKVR